MAASFVRFAAEDFGHDAFHLAAITLIDQSGAPGDQRVAGDDQAGQAAQTAADQLARGDRRAIGFAESGPRNHAGHHQPHRARGVGTQGDATEIQPVIGDRQPVAARRLEQIGGRHAEIAKDDPQVVRVLQSVEAVMLKLKMRVLLCRQIDDQHRRPAFDESDQRRSSAPAARW